MTGHHPDLAQRKREFEETVRNFRKAVLFDYDLTAVQHVLAPGFVDHFAPPWDPPSRDGVAHRFDHANQVLTTRKVEVLVSVCEGDILAQAILLHFEHTGPFMGIPATGRRFEIGGSNTFRFEDGRIAEHWGVFDVAKIPDLLAGEPGAAGGWSSMWDREEIGTAGKG
ncbi:ester cyclase [Micromonospora chersina]|uniref:ester cyclase n=1 Tax=Micromonospora chersina TaxID=47854 RepID=UPI0033BCE38B